MTRLAARLYAVFFTVLGVVAGIGCVTAALAPSVVGEESGALERIFLLAIGVFMSLVFLVGHAVSLIPTASRLEIVMDGEDVIALHSWFMTVEGCRLSRDTFVGASTDEAGPIALLPWSRVERWTVHEAGRLTHVRPVLLRLCSAAMGLRSPFCLIRPPRRDHAYLLPADPARIMRASWVTAESRRGLRRPVATPQERHRNRIGIGR